MSTLEIHQKDGNIWRMDVLGSLEIGRQRIGEPNPIAFIQGSGENGFDRLVVAPLAEASFSRRQITLELINAKTLRLTNTSKKPWQLDVETMLEPNQVVEKSIPCSFALHTLLFKVHADSQNIPVDEVEIFHSITDSVSGHATILEQSNKLANVTDAEFIDIVNWLQMTMQVLQGTIGSQDFIKEAAVALVDIVGLESGRVLLGAPGNLKVATAHPPEFLDIKNWEPNKNIVKRLSEFKKTIWHTGEIKVGKTNLGAMAVVAAPIMDSKGNFLGVLYGERSPTGSERRSAIIEGLLVDMLACGLSTGLVRQTHEKDAVQARVQFEQFFTPELARQLALEPTLLHGREADATLLFCDLRGFSRISERIGPEGTNKLMSAIFDALSKCVQDQSGVLVDYLGDGMLAMWGAPGHQPDHAKRCVIAAQKMQMQIPLINEKWSKLIGEPLALGIGINSGKTWVGNTGSSIKFKYGPLGPSVNLASRVEGLTKYLRSYLLITGATKKLLDDSFLTRRVCKTTVVNVVEPVDIYEVFVEANEKSKRLKQVTEQALIELEKNNFREASKISGFSLAEFPDDGPLILILHRAVDMLMNPTQAFQPVWHPPGK
ncbi:MAG: adenylate/guanylate cyclase domain-containing protein [Planctomycetota bacterium]|nr:MAG: adenylate/guanylate cyclase domain-containing protein [Planctomycetota bacterium]